MATTGSKKTVPVERNVPRRDGNLPPVHLDLVLVHQELGEEIMGWVACCVLIGLLLPLGGMLYLDILEAKNEVKAQAEKVERLRRKVEKENREQDRNVNSDRPKPDGL